MDKIIAKSIESASNNSKLRRFIKITKINDRVDPIVQLNLKLGGMPAFSGNKIQVIDDYYGVFSLIIKDINEARKFVHVEYYALALDEETEPVFEAMQNAVERGVKVRVLFDWFGSRRYPHYHKMKSQ